jgi:hypothetical protein
MEGPSHTLRSPWPPNAICLWLVEARGRGALLEGREAGIDGNTKSGFLWEADYLHQWMGKGEGSSLLPGPCRAPTGPLPGPYRAPTGPLPGPYRAPTPSQLTTFSDPTLPIPITPHTKLLGDTESYYRAVSVKTHNWKKVFPNQVFFLMETKCSASSYTKLRA